MIEKTFYSDLLYICKFEDGSFENQLVTDELYKVGFLAFNGISGGGLYNNKKDSKEDAGGIIYKINAYGLFLKDILKK
jgi:hypothetical protein